MNMVEQGEKGRLLESENAVQKTRCILISGFFGAGKTTAIAKLGAYIERKGMQVSIITNDQGQELVDSAALRARGFEVNEVDAGSIDHSLNPWAEATRKMAQSPCVKVVITEPGGSTADLRNAITNPLLKTHPDSYMVAPLTVMLDPARLARVFGIEPGQGFSDSINYLYRKQLEEADCIVLNKIDLISQSRLHLLNDLIKKHHPRARIFWVSAQSGEGLTDWFDFLLSEELEPRTRIDFDYDLYQQAATKLGWLNCSVRLSSVKYWDSGRMVMELASSMHNMLRTERAEIAHLKMNFTPEELDGSSASVNVTRNDAVPELSVAPGEPVQSGTLLLNARAEADPELLHASFNRALLAVAEKNPHLFARLEHCEHFRPIHIHPS